MNVLLTLLAVIFGIGGIVCSIIILIDAFQDAIWKGLLCFFCGLYGLYYALFEFEHDNKWLIVLGSFFGSGIAYGLMMLTGR